MYLNHVVRADGKIITIHLLIMVIIGITTKKSMVVKTRNLLPLRLFRIVIIHHQLRHQKILLEDWVLVD